MSIEVVDVTGGEVLVAGPMTVRIVEDGSHTEHRLGIVEVTIPPRIDGPPQHLHRQHDETFFVVSGEPTFTSGGETVAARPGMLITAPPGTPHIFANPGDVPVVMLCTVTPDLYIDYFRELAALPRGALDPRAVAEIMSRYATEVVPPACRAVTAPSAPAAVCPSANVQELLTSTEVPHRVPTGLPPSAVFPEASPAAAGPLHGGRRPGIVQGHPVARRPTDVRTDTSAA